MEPKTPTAEQIDRIGELALVVFGDDQWVWEEIGRPLSHEEAGAMISTMMAARSRPGRSSVPLVAELQAVRSRFPTPGPARQPAERICSNCSESKAPALFPKTGRKCKACLAKYQRARYARERTKRQGAADVASGRQPARPAKPAPARAAATEVAAAPDPGSVFRNPPLDKLRLIAQLLEGSLQEAADFCDAMMQISAE